MKKFAVAFMCYFDNILTIEIHEADDWRAALIQHSALSEQGSEAEEAIPDNLEDAKEYFFDGDCLIDVIPIPTHQRISL